MNRVRHFTAFCCVVALVSSTVCPRARGAGEIAERAPDFPPGVFSDQGRYSLSDFKGKVVVLFFYEQECPTCRGSIPERNQVVEAFKGRPVKFIAIAAEDSPADAQAYVKSTKLAMPAFADSLGVMQARYGQKISLRNIYQFRVIGPDGKVSGYTMDQAAIEMAVADVKWKYKEDGQDPRVAKAAELLEWNQYDAGMRALRPLLKVKATAVQAQTVYDKVKAEATGWAGEAAKAADGDPVAAYDLYTRVQSCLPDEEVGKQAKDAVATLKTEKSVAAELAARKMYEQLDLAFAKAKPTQKAEVAKFCLNIAKKYKGTPTGAKAQALADELARTVAAAG